MKKMSTRLIALMLCLSMVMGLTISASAADWENSIIDTGRKGSIEIYKWDLTNAEKDHVWDSSYMSTGVQDSKNVEDILYQIRKGDTDGSSDVELGAPEGGTSVGYAIAGVEFTYLRIADVVQYTETELEDGLMVNKTKVLYGIPTADSYAKDFLAAIDLKPEDNYVPSEAVTNDTDFRADHVYFDADVLVDALKAALTQNSTDVKDALEVFVAKQVNNTEHGGSAMPVTDRYGYTSADNLDLGLYLLVETKVPEMVVDTTDPFLVALPMTSVNGTNTGIDGGAPEGGTEWLYDLTLYPKNLTGIPSLEKTLRESMADTGNHNGSETDITSAAGWSHVGTASAGDVIEYQIISTLPSITSAATYLTQYGILDTITDSLTYQQDSLKIQFFSDEACTKPLGTVWTKDSGFFTATFGTGANNTNTMDIKMTAKGLEVINSSTEVYKAATAVNSGYSDCTMRITYKATFDSNEDLVCGDAGNSNKVVLTWARTNTPYYDTLVDDCHIYTYGIDLLKLFSDNQGNFNHVEFLLQNTTDDNYYVTAELGADGIYYVTGHVTEEADATHFIPVTSGTQGTDSYKGAVIIKGLEDDTYVMTEVRTDDGYTLLKERIEIVISNVETTEICEIYLSDVVGLIQNDPRYAEALINQAIANNWITSGTSAQLADVLHNMPQKYLEHHLLTASATVDGNSVDMLTDNGSENAEAPMTIVNTKGFDLPETGESGAFILPAIGAISMISACCMIFFVAMPKKKEME